MLEQVMATIQKYSMYSPGDRVLAGVSGGPDSVALVHVLHDLAGELKIKLFIAHLDHSFRGRESAEDAEFVRMLADRLGLPAQIEARNVPEYARQKNLSPQTAAREVRYRFFEETARRLGCNKLATGHNANDQAETVLLHFLRGTGLAGLGGIPPVRDGWITRPLIEVTRDKIEEYCRNNGLSTRMDSSNLKNVYTRNKIRLDLIPALEKEYNPNLVETLVRNSELMRDEERCLETLTDKYWADTCMAETSDRIVFKLDRLLALDRALQRRLIRRAWARLAAAAYGLEYIHLRHVMEIVSGKGSGLSFHLPTGVLLTKSYNELILTVSTSAGEAGAAGGFAYRLEIPGITYIPEAGLAISAQFVEKGLYAGGQDNPDEITIDFDRVSPPLAVRNRRPGDRFSPRGFRGTRKLKKYLIDKKVPRTERDRLPVVVTADDQVVWVAGMRADGRWLAGPGTERAVRLKLLKNI